MSDRSPRLRLVQAVTTPGTSQAQRAAQAAARFAIKYGKALPKVTQAELRGIWRFFAWLHKYINAANYMDMRDGKPANARAHHEVVKERRAIAGFWLGVALVGLWWLRHHYGPAGLSLPAVAALVALGYWGKDLRILDPLSGTGVGLSETGIRAAVAAAILGVNLEKFPEAWKAIEIVKGLRQDGETMRITLRLPGKNPGSMARLRRENLASALNLQARQCIIEVDPMRRNASEFEFSIHPDAPFNVEPVRSSLLRDPRPTSFWDDIDFGTDINGRPVKVNLPYKAMLIGGLPDMGKTTAALNILSHAMLDPWVRLWVIDGKGIDFPGIAPMCWSYVGNSQDEAITALQELYRTGEAKLERLRELGEQKITRELQGREIRSELITPLCFMDVLFIDEMRFFTAGDDPKKSRLIVSLLSRIVEMFRACGIIVVCSTQRPSTDVVDSSLRDLIRIRAALATTTWQTSNTILGDTAYKAGYSATEFESEDKGVMWLRELKEFKQVRANLVEHHDFNMGCRFAFDLRNSTGTLPDQIEDALVPAAPPFLAKLRDVIIREGQGRLPTRDILATEEFREFTADSLGKEARKHHLQSNEVGPWGDKARVRGYRLDDIAAAVAECAKDPEFKPGIRGVVGS